MTSVNQLTTATLEYVKSKFDHWRADKKEFKIPEELWQQVRILEQFYKPSLIRDKLGISGSQYRKNVPQFKTPSTFLEVSANMKSSAPKRLAIKSIETNATVIEIHRLDGAHLLISHINTEIISQVIHSFLR